jgi:hypothetical protein
MKKEEPIVDQPLGPEGAGKPRAVAHGVDHERCRQPTDTRTGLEFDGGHAATPAPSTVSRPDPGAGSLTWNGVLYSFG